MSSTLPDERQRRLAHNEARYRYVNEEIRSAADRFDGPGAIFAFMCECADENCAELVEMSIADYERLRSSPVRFAVRPGHEVEAIERVVDRHEGLYLIEKIDAGAEVARAEDPRASNR